MAASSNCENRTKIAYLMILVYVFTIFIVLWGVLYVTVNQLTVESWIHGMITFVLGAMSTQIGNIITYFYGDSLNNTQHIQNDFDVAKKKIDWENKNHKNDDYSED